MVAEEEAKLRSALNAATKYSKEDRDAKASYSKIEEIWAHLNSANAIKNSNSKEAKKEYQESMSKFADTLASVVSDMKDEKYLKEQQSANYRRQTDQILFDLGDKPINEYDFRYPD